jgi:hypothetical protein
LSKDGSKTEFYLPEANTSQNRPLAPGHPDLEEL